MAEVLVMFYASTLSSSLSPSDDRRGMAARIDSVRLKIVTDRRHMHHVVAGVMQPSSVPRFSSNRGSGGYQCQ